MSPPRVPRQEAQLLAGTSALAFAQPLLDLLARGPEFFVAHDLDRGTILMVVALVCWGPALLVALVPLGLRPWPRLRRAAVDLLLAFFGCLIALAALRSWTAVPAVVAVASALLVGCGLPYALRHWPTLRAVSPIAALALIVVPIAFALQPGVAPLLHPRPTVEVPGLATTTHVRPTPVVLVVFDELALASLIDDQGRLLRHRFPQLARFADRATWYRRTAAAAETTGKAMPAILTGQWPRPRTPPTVDAYPTNLFTWLAASHDLWAFEPMSRLCPTHLNRVGDTEARARRPQARGLGRDLSIVYLHRVLPGAWGRHLPPIDQGWRDFGPPSLSPREPAVEATDEAPFDVFARAVEATRDDRRLALGAFLDSLDQRDATLHVLHAMLPHLPWYLTESGQAYTPPTREPGLRDGVWQAMPFWVRQGQQRYLQQLRFVDAFVGRLIDELESLDRFDDSLIVLTADHGVAFRPGHHRRLFDDATAADIVPVPLFVKAPGQRRGMVVDRVLSSVDIVPTILDHLGLQDDAAAADGLSALDPAHDRDTLPVLTENRGVVDVGVDVFDDLARSSRRQQVTFGTGADALDLFRIGPQGDLVGQRLDDLRVASAEAWRWSTTPADAYPNVDRDGPSLPALLQATIFVPRDARQRGELAVALNGTIAATLPLPEGARVKRDITVLLPTSLFVDGQNRVDLFRMRATRSGVVLHPIERVSLDSYPSE